MKNTTGKTRQKFDETFKRSAVQNWLSSGKSAEVIAEELGIKQDRLYAWKKRFAPSDSGGATFGAGSGRGAIPGRCGSRASRGRRGDVAGRAAGGWRHVDSHLATL